MILWDVFKVIIISAKSLLAEEISKVTVQNSLNSMKKFVLILMHNIQNDLMYAKIV